MKHIQLSCFQNFRCIADQCRDSCCIGWEIEVDRESAARYQSVPGPFGEELRRKIAAGEGGSFHYILTPEERCPFLQEDGLCRQILELGEESLCEICANHPRFFLQYGDVEEQGVGLACEEAARLLFTDPGPLTLVESGTGALPQGEEGALCRMLLAWREACFAATEEETRSLHQRLGELLRLGREAEAALWGEQWEGEAPAVLPGHALLWLDQLTQMEPIDGEWSAALEDALAAAEYPEMLEEFALEGEKRQYDRLLVYLLFRYALRSLRDGDPRGWTDFVVFFVLTVELLDFGRWMKNGRHFSSRDRQDIARIVSKEIEYDPELLDGLWELFGECEPFQMGN